MAVVEGCDGFMQLESGRDGSRDNDAHESFLTPAAAAGTTHVPEISMRSESE
jgi:hypothetical protein